MNDQLNPIEPADEARVTTNAIEVVDVPVAQVASTDSGSEGFPSAEELATVDANLDDIESVLKNLDVDKGLEATCAELAEVGDLGQRPALEAFWRAKTEAKSRR